MITKSKGKLDAIYPALLATINNIAAYLENLGTQSSLKLLHLYILMSSPSFLLANETNHLLLHSLLEAMNAIIEHQYTREFLLRNLRTVGFANSQQEIQISSMPSSSTRTDSKLYAPLR